MTEAPSLDPLCTGDPAVASDDPLSTADRDGGAGIPAAGADPATRYVLGEQIARGGMGVIYRPTDTVLSREVAGNGPLLPEPRAKLLRLFFDVRCRRPAWPTNWVTASKASSGLVESNATASSFRSGGHGSSALGR